MPQVSFYLRQGDIDAWRALENKAEFIHNALKGSTNHINTLEDLGPSEAAPSIDLPTCCKGMSPCKHWIWDGVQESYINSLSGEVREA